MKFLKGKLKNKIKYVITDTKCKSGSDVIIMIRINVGSRDEEDSIKGISHLLEHMFFRGTKNRSSQEELISPIYKNGGSYNAYTTKDSTVFYVVLPNKFIEVGFDILSDSFYNSLFNAEDLEKEKKIVINEINDYLSDPGTLIDYGLSELVFKGTRLEKDIAGDVKTVKSIDSNMLKSFVNTYYNSNTIISVAGNINIEKTLVLLKKYFNKNVKYLVENKNEFIHLDKKRELYHNLFTKQKKFQMKYIKRNDEQSFIGINFITFNITSLKKYPLIIISELLTGYLGSELYKKLRIEKGLIYSISSDLNLFEDIGDFSISYSTLNNSDNVINTIEIILQEIQKIKKGLIDFKLLNNCKSNLINNYKLSPENNEYIATKFSNDLYYNKKIITIDEIIENIKKITIENIINVSEEIFLPEKCNICYTCKDFINFL